MKKYAHVLFVCLATLTLLSCKKKDNDTPLNILMPAGYQEALSAGRYYMAAASLGNKAFFAGGLSSFYNNSTFQDQFTYYNNVDIYDATTGQWSTAALSQPRAHLVAAAAGNKIVFAGGVTAVAPYYSDKVDIFDIGTGQWSTAALSQPRAYLAAAAAGNKILFAGGQGVGSTLSDKVDIYDVGTGQWSTDRLSQARNFLGGSGAGNKIVFAGGINATGYSDKADIYDVTTGQWAAASLSQARPLLVAVSAGSQIIFSGGSLNTTPPGSNKVDIYNTANGTWTSRNMNTGRHFFASASLGNKVIMAGGTPNGDGVSNSMEVLDLSNNTTDASTYFLKEKVFAPSAVTIGGKILIAGGVYPISLNGEKRYENRQTVNFFELR